MRISLIERVRASNPITSPPAVAPFESIAEALRASEELRAGKRRSGSRLAGAIAAVGILVGVLLVVMLAGGRNQTPDVLAAVMRATASGPFHSVSETTQRIDGRVVLVTRRETWSRPAQDRSRTVEISAEPTTGTRTTIETVIDSSGMRRWSSARPDAIVFVASRAGHAIGASGSEIEALRALHRQRVLRVAGRVRRGNRSLWRLVGRTRDRTKPGASQFVALVDPKTYWPVEIAQYNVTVDNAGRAIDLTTRYVSYSTRTPAASSLRMTAHPGAQVLRRSVRPPAVRRLKSARRSPRTPTGGHASAKPFRATAGAPAAGGHTVTKPTTTPP